MALNRTRQRGTKAEVARLLLCDKSSIGRWTKTVDFPREDAAGTIDLFDACEWYFRRKILAELDDESSPINSEGLERLRQAKAAIAEIELAERRGEMVTLNQFEEVAQAILSPYRSLGDFVKQIGHDEILQRIEETNQQVLTGLEQLFKVQES